MPRSAPMDPLPRVVILGQAPPRREAAVPYERTRLWKWLGEVGVSKVDADWTFLALLDYFPGSTSSGDRTPTPQEIAANAPRVTEAINKVKPACIISVGRLAGGFLCGDELPLDELVGATRRWRGSIPFVVLPHPSGRNAWPYSSETRRTLVASALEGVAELIKR